LETLWEPEKWSQANIGVVTLKNTHMPHKPLSHILENRKILHNTNATHPFLLNSPTTMMARTKKHFKTFNILGATHGHAPPNVEFTSIFLHRRRTKHTSRRRRRRSCCSRGGQRADAPARAAPTVSKECDA
jgi:hypothetical protein